MYTDMHVHSDISVDSKAKMEDTIKKAIEKGVKVLCFTDHCDPMCGATPGLKQESSFENWQASYEKIAQVREQFGDNIEILHGMELGEIPQDPIRTGKWAQAKGLDFVIGSVHILPHMQDFHLLQYGDPKSCRDLTSLYLDENIRLAKENIADVVGHVGYINRYMKRQGKYVNLLDFQDKLEVLFQTLVENGRGIEINCSGLRQVGLEETFPNLAVLKLYKAKGGEIITIGSDAHFPQHVGEGFHTAIELAKEAGFRYISVFRDRKAGFISV